MGLILKDSGQGEYKLVPAGTHIGVCDMIVDVGLQHTTHAGEPKIQHKVYIRWELPNERLEDGRPMTVGCLYTMSFGRNAYLRRDLEAWRGRAFTAEELAGFDLTSVAGKACQVVVTHSDDGQWANVKGLAGIPKGMEHPKAENPIIIFDVDNPHNLDDLPPWLQKKYAERAISGGNVPVHAPNETPHSALDIDDSIPF